MPGVMLSCLFFAPLFSLFYRRGTRSARFLRESGVVMLSYGMNEALPGFPIFPYLFLFS